MTGHSITFDEFSQIRMGIGEVSGSHPKDGLKLLLLAVQLPGAKQPLELSFSAELAEAMRDFITEHLHEIT